MDRQADDRDSGGAEHRSRRLALRAGAGALAMAFLARGMGAVAVHQAVSPTPAYAAGVTAEILGRVELTVAPGYALQLMRITFGPGAAVAAHRHSGATVTTQLSGSHAFVVLDGDARLIRAGSATPTAGAEAGASMTVGEEYTIQPGDVMLFDERVIHTAHNPSGAPAVLMEAQLRAVDRPLTEFIPDMATPVA